MPCCIKHTTRCCWYYSTKVQHVYGVTSMMWRDHIFSQRNNATKTVGWGWTKLGKVEGVRVSNKAGGFHKIGRYETSIQRYMFFYNITSFLNEISFSCIFTCVGKFKITKGWYTYDVHFEGRGVVKQKWDVIGRRGVGG